MNEKMLTKQGERTARSQAEVFLLDEGDKWFARNRVPQDATCTQSVDMSFLIETLGPHRDSINSVLEVGCSDGLKLAQLCAAFGSRGWGIDPSRKAIDCGNEQRAGDSLRLLVGVAHELPFSTATFDLVYFGFCLYLVDRDKLSTALREANRVLKPGGFLAITDFDPSLPHSKPYHHRAGIHSHKMDYAAVLASPGAYQLIHKRSFSHRQPFFDHESGERISVSVLYKELENTGETPIVL